ncbi:type VII secretion protein EccE, partial [Streptomyces anulatus]
MGAATRERTGRAGRRSSGTSRRQRSNESPATPPARPSGTSGQNAPAATTLRSISRTDRVRPVLRQMVIVEVGLVIAAVGAALGGAWLIPSLVVLCLLVALAVVRRRGRALQDWVSGALGLRARRRGAPPPPPAGGPGGGAGAAHGPRGGPPVGVVT